MIKYLSSAIANNICDKTDANTKYEIIEYGIECIINTLIPVLIYTVYALLNRIFLSFIIWFVSFLLFRNLMGGYHASTHLKCIILSCVYGLLSLHIIKCTTMLSIYCIIPTYLFIIIIHLFINPIIHHEEDNNVQYINHTRKKLLITLSIVFLLVLVFNTVPSEICIPLFWGTVCAEVLFLIGKVQRSSLS